MWLGQDAINNAVPETAILTNGDTTTKIALLVDKYYPVRMRYTENFGGHECTIVFGLNNTTFANNQENAAVGQFFSDDLTATTSYPNISHLVV